MNYLQLLNFLIFLIVSQSTFHWSWSFETVARSYITTYVEYFYQGVVSLWGFGEDEGYFKDTQESTLEMRCKGGPCLLWILKYDVLLYIFSWNLFYSQFLVAQMKFDHCWLLMENPVVCLLEKSTVATTLENTFLKPMRASFTTLHMNFHHTALLKWYDLHLEKLLNMLSYLMFGNLLLRILVAGEIVCYTGVQETVAGVVSMRRYHGTVCQTTNKCFHAAINYQESGNPGNADC